MLIGPDPLMIGSQPPDIVYTWELITWSSKKQRVVAKSSTEAEYRALSQTTAEIAWLHSIFKEFGLTHKTPAIIWCDNAGAKQLLANPVFHNRTKHIEVDVHYIRDLIAQGLVEIRFVPTTEQTTDIFTKAVSIDKFRYLNSKLTIMSKPESSLREPVEKNGYAHT